MTSGTAPWAAAPCALSEWSFYHWVGSFLVPGQWLQPVSGIRATLLPAQISFCAAVSVKQYDTYDSVTALLSQLLQHPSQPCCASSELPAQDKGAARGTAAHKSTEGEPAVQLSAA